MIRRRRSPAAPSWRDALRRLPIAGAARAAAHRLCCKRMFDQIVIVGAGQAAAQAVDTLRCKGFTGKLAVVGVEPWLQYQRTPCAKKYLAGARVRSRIVV